MRMLTRALASAFFLLATAGLSAQSANPVYDILFDLDRNAATGCAASPTGVPAFGGYERRLRATLNPMTLTVDTIEVETCDGNLFQPLMPLSAGQPAGLNNGIDGTDVIEVAVDMDALDFGSAGLIDLTFTADSGAGSDILATRNGAPDGPQILFGLPVLIPTLSGFALLLLAALVVALAWRAHRRAGQLSAVGMVMLVAVVAWAMDFAADGDVSDWTGLAPAASDPNGDSTDGNSGIDLRAAFFVLENGALFFRLDLTDVENQAPVAVDDSYSADEDTVLNIASPGVLGNDADANGDPITAALQSGPANAQAFVLNADGSFDYTPNADFNGADSFTYLANDGQADSEIATVSITITPVNDAPSFTPGADPTVLEDAGLQSIAGWATGISAGPADEGGQMLTFNVINNSNPGLFSAGPAIDPTTGDLTFTTAVDANGTADLTIALADDGGTAGSGVDTSDSDVFSINVTEVNDAPEFTAGADVTVLEDSGAYSQPWATAISAGPADESGQLVSFNITGNTSPSLFAAGPVIAADGTLSFTPAADAFGSSTITVEAVDDGGTANGGVDTSAAIDFVITISGVNDVPVLDLDSSDATATGLDFATAETCGSAPILLQDPVNASLTDADDVSLESLTITLTNLLNEGHEFIRAAPETVAPANPDIVAAAFDTGSTPGQGVLTLSGTDSLSDYQAALRSITYENTLQAPDLADRIVTFVANDGEGNSIEATATVNVTPFDAVPVGGDVLPPQRVIAPQPPYTQEALDANIEGNVIVQTQIDCRGNVIGVNVLLGLGFGLDESVVNTLLSSWRFDPATQNGIPVSVFWNLTINFTLP